MKDMNIHEIKLSVSQIKKMQHAIGLDNPSQSKTKQVAYRNYYAAGDDPEWNEVVEKGLAVKRADPFCKGDYIYHLTAQGIEYLSSILGKEITVSK